MYEETERTDPQTAGATLASMAAAHAAVLVRSRSRQIADSADVRLRRTSDPALVADLHLLREDALTLCGLANLATLLPRERSPGRWALFMAFLRG